MLKDEKDRVHSSEDLPTTDRVIPADQTPATNTEIIASAYDAPPNGGFYAWLQVAGSFFIFFNSWGTINTFGVYQTYYQYEFPDQSPSNISWIGALQAFLLLSIGVLVGPLYDAGYFRMLVTTGGLLIVLGWMMTSLIHEFWQAVVAQAFVIGLGAGCLWIPSLAILPQYFTTKKALATGIAASGSSLGGTIYPIVFRQLQPHIGFAWATRVIGFIALVTMSFSICVMRVRAVPKQRRALVDISAFREMPYTLFCLAQFWMYVGLFPAIFYISEYALETHITNNQNLAFYLLAILNAASTLGRIVPGYIAGFAGPVNVLLLSVMTTAAFALAWIGIHTTSGIIAFAVLYGYFSGGIVSLPAVALTHLTPDLRKLGTRMGMNSAICSLGSLCGSPVAGAILSGTGSYLGVQLFSGFALLMSAALLFGSRCAKVGPKPWVKV